MKITKEGLELIKRFEGFRGQAYRDPVGVWTIGYGHTSAAGAPLVTQGMVVTAAEAEEILRQDVAMFEDGVDAAVSRDISAAQFSALVSFAYNVGLGNFKKSSVLKAVNAGNFEAVPRRLHLWNKAGGRVLAGLIRRRAEEGAMFVKSAKPMLTQQVEKSLAKAPAQSTTLWASFIGILITALQLFIKGTITLLGVMMVVFVVALFMWIMRERYLKLKQEGV